jgi:1-acyl-sn-glycerol-3-phosphate acyltransferase
MNERDAIKGTRVAESNTTHAPRLSGRLRYWWALILAGTLLFVMGLPVFLVAWLIGRLTLVYPYARWGARTWLRLIGVRVRLRGEENLDPAETYVFIANHRSYLDPAALLVHLDKRQLGFIAKKELLRVPVLGQFMGCVNAVAIDRSNRERAISTMKDATEHIHAGISFVVFAEGTRARPGELLPFKKGGFYMAMEAGVKVVPVAIKNTDALMGKGTGEASPGTIEIVVLPPVETSEISTDEGVANLIDKLHASIAVELKQ